MSIQRERLRAILALALPIIGGMVSQNVLNLVDTAMVGTLGPTALAAVGMASIANFVSQAFIQGISSGVQAIAARRKGQGNEKESATALNGGLFLSLTLGIPCTLILLQWAPWIFAQLENDPEVVALGIPYWQSRLVAVTAVGMNFAFRGYWNGISMSKLYLRTLLVMHTANIALNYVLIFGKLGFPALGSTGAGIGTSVATFIGTLTYFGLGLKHARNKGFLTKLPDRTTLRSILRIATPNGVQQVFFATGLLTLQWIIGTVGTVELAAATVLLNITLVALLPGLGLGLAAASLVGQALGRDNKDDARQWGWDVVKVGLVIMMGLGLPMVAVPDLLLSIFLHDADTLAVARLPLRLVGLAIGFDAVGMVLMNALLGAGASRDVMAVSVTMQWLLFLPAAWVVGPYLGFGLIGIWLVQSVYRGLQAGVFGMLWERGAWADIRV